MSPSTHSQQAPSPAPFQPTGAGSGLRPARRDGAEAAHQAVFELAARGAPMGEVMDALRAARTLEAAERAREREQAARALRDTARRNDLFVALLGHELRNPIGALRNSVHILARRELPEPGPRVLQLMNGQLEQLIRLTDDLLDVSRIAQGKLEMRVEQVELHDAVRKALEAARPLCTAKRQQLHYDPLPERIHLLADGARVTQMVTNLLVNASKFTPAEGEVRVRLERAGNEAVIRVRDTGAGIPADQQERIFQLYAQMEEGRQFAAQGLGIGLPLVRYLAASHRGSVEVHSPGPGLGSEFILRLPLPLPAA